MTFSCEAASRDRAKPSMRSVRLLSLGARMFLLVAWASSSVIAQTSIPLRRVLVLYSDERPPPANVIADEAIRATFAAESSNRVEFHSEFLDVSRFPGEAQQQRERDFLRDKYRERPPDLVIAGGGPALEFLLKYRAVLFADVPIVHCAVEALPKEMPDAKIAGIPMLRAAASTLELALSLQPDTRNVAVVAGSTPQDLESAEQFRGETPTFGDRAGFTWLTNLSLPDFARRAVAAAGPHGGALPDDVSGCHRRFVHPAAGADLVRACEPCSDLWLLRHLPGVWDCRRLDGDV